MKDKPQIKRGPKPRPGNHQTVVMRVPKCLAKDVKDMIDNFKNDNGYV